jgi:hypothetical protein
LRDLLGDSLKTAGRAIALVVCGLALSGCGSEREALLVGKWTCETAWGPWRHTTIMDYRADHTGRLTMHASGTNQGVRVDLKYGFDTSWAVDGDRWLKNKLSAVEVISATANGIRASDLETDMIIRRLDEYTHMREGEIVEFAPGRMVVGQGDGRTECALGA